MLFQYFAQLFLAVIGVNMEFLRVHWSKRLHRLAISGARKLSPSVSSQNVWFFKKNSTKCPINIFKKERFPMCLFCTEMAEQNENQKITAQQAIVGATVPMWHGGPSIKYDITGLSSFQFDVVARALKFHANQPRARKMTDSGQIAYLKREKERELNAVKEHYDLKIVALEAFYEISLNYHCRNAYEMFSSTHSVKSILTM